ncbi:MAG: GDSL-type esterase/lipase family protein [Chitinophagaceae bacterium]
MTHYTYLALGDSYTIAEGIPLHQSFPYQLVQLLRRQHYSFYAPEIVAQTGWTTGELLAVMEQQKFLSEYDIITLCIGVNNQYRGLELEAYKNDLELLLQKALVMARDKKTAIIMLSIPDYSLTPYAVKYDQKCISNQIGIYNSIGKALSIQYKICYADLTQEKTETTDLLLLAADELHPSAEQYKRWATLLLPLVTPLLRK